MNYMKQVAEMLGLSWDEEKCESEQFEIPRKRCDYRFKNKGLYAKPYGHYDSCSDHMIGEILIGKLEIKKLPWKPRPIENCWIATPFDHEMKAAHTIYYGSKEYCRHCLKLDLYRKTEAEAIARTDEILKLMGVDADGGIE